MTNYWRWTFADRILNFKLVVVVFPQQWIKENQDLSMFVPVFLYCDCTLSFDSRSVLPLLSVADVTVFIIHSCCDYGPYHITLRTGWKRRESKKYFEFFFYFFFLISLEAFWLRSSGHWYYSFQLTLCFCSLGLFGSLSLYLTQGTQ